MQENQFCTDESIYEQLNRSYMTFINQDLENEELDKSKKEI